MRISASSTGTRLPNACWATAARMLSGAHATTCCRAATTTTRPGVGCAARWRSNQVAANRLTPSQCAHCPAAARRRWINVSILPFPVISENGDRLVVHLFRDSTLQKQHEALSSQILAAVQNLRQPQPGNAEATDIPDLPEASLTRREQQVLEMLAHGMSTPQVAELLSISVSTTRNHVQNIFQKLQVHSRAQAVAYAFEHGLVSRQ